MPKLPNTFDAANAAICALGDEAHYEQLSRHAGLNPDAMAIIERFSSSAERAALVIAYMDSFDIAADRCVVAASLGVEHERVAA